MDILIKLLIISFISVYVDNVYGAPSINSKDSNLISAESNPVSQGIDNALSFNSMQNNDGENNSKLPPLLFPDDPKIFKIVPPVNETALKILTHTDEASKLEAPEDRPIDDDVREANDSSSEFRDRQSKEFTTVEEIKDDVEDFQSFDDSRPSIELEERFRSQIANLRLKEVFMEDIETEAPKLNTGHYIMAITGGVIALLCAAIYVGLVSWRNYLENRYGMLERLVTEDDYDNNNDFRRAQL